MITIKSSDGCCIKIQKEKLLKINYFQKYFSSEYVNNKELIELNYNSNVIKIFIDNIEDNKETIHDKDIIMEYIYFLNYIGFDNNILNLLDLFDDYRIDIEYILEIVELYPKYINIIQEKLNKYIFDNEELRELENNYSISNYNLYFTINSYDVNENIGNVKLSMILGNEDYLNKINFDRIYGVIYRNNEFTEIPREIINLPNLNYLDLSWNKISIIPKEISNLTNLRSLNLSWNRISEILKEISNLTNLQSLNLSNNIISEIPRELSYLTNLQSLNFSNNINK